MEVRKASIGLAVLAFAALAYLSDLVPFTLVLLLLVIAALVEWHLVRVQIADNDPQSR